MSVVASISGFNMVCFPPETYELKRYLMYPPSTLLHPHRECNCGTRTEQFFEDSDSEKGRIAESRYLFTWLQKFCNPTRQCFWGFPIWGREKASLLGYDSHASEGLPYLGFFRILGSILRGSFTDNIFLDFNLKHIIQSMCTAFPATIPYFEVSVTVPFSPGWWSIWQWKSPQNLVAFFQHPHFSSQHISICYLHFLIPQVVV